MSRCDHHHHANDTDGIGGRLGWGVGLTVGFVAIEAVAGWFAGSLSLLSDAGHNLSDAAALGVSWYAVRVARKPAHSGMTFGYHRVGIIAALLNAASLVVIGGWILYEAVERFRHPIAVHGWTTAAVAAAAVAVNLVVHSWLHGHDDDINIRSARLHMLGDAIAAGGVVVAGIVVAVTGWSTADPVVSVAIAILILHGAWRPLKESIVILLEGTPAGVDVDAVRSDLSGIVGVLDVHDLHLWTVGPGLNAASLHARIADQSVQAGQAVTRVVETVLQRHGIHHTTVQIETECRHESVFCRMEPGRASSH